MRAPASILAIGAIAALGACHKVTPPAATAPIRSAAVGGAPLTAGLWVQRVSDSGGVQVLRYCLDGGAAQALASFDGRLNSRCSRHDMAQAADGSWHFSTQCDMGRWGKVATEGVMRGDFRSHYTIQAETQRVGAPGFNGPGRVTADVRRVGACPAGMRPGDVILPNGAHARMNSISGQA